jgi:hypothetical protein
VADVTGKIQSSNSPTRTPEQDIMASRDILTTDISYAATDRSARMPAWFEIAPRAGQSASNTPAVAVSTGDMDMSWLESGSDQGVEVIEHHVPAELLAAFFGKAAHGSAMLAIC